MELVSLLDRKKQEEGRRVEELGKIYEKMEPAKAAYLIKELDNILIAHTNAAVGMWFTHRFGIRGAMQIDITS